jgi:uncharacterized membrane protein
MRNGYPHPASDGVRSLVVGILLSIITCGIYGLYWQYKQMKTLNAWLGRQDFSFWLWFFLSLMTCGIFGIYYEYKLAKGINEIQENHSFRVNNDLPVICLLLAIFGIGVGSLAIQQFEINKFYDETSDI